MTTKTEIEILDKIKFYLQIILACVLTFVIYSVYNDMEDNKEFNRMMICDWYAYDQVNAPSFCK